MNVYSQVTCEPNIVLNGASNIAASFTGAIYFNGTTDYVEMFVIQATGGNLSIYNNNGSTYNWFEGAFLRAA